MAWTWEKIERIALSESGVLGQGQTFSASLQAKAEEELMLLLDEFDGLGLALPEFSFDFEFNTVAGQRKYFLGTGTQTAAFPLRPETFVSVVLTISGGANPTQFELIYLPYPQYTAKITNKETAGQPYNYSFNPRWPQMEFFVYPEPNQVWPVVVTAKMKWVDTVGDPTVNPFAIAQIPSGYPSALTSCLAYRLAKRDRQLTPQIINANRDGRFLISSYVNGQAQSAASQVPIVYPYTLVATRHNP